MPCTVDIYSCGASSDQHKAFDYIVDELKQRIMLIEVKNINFKSDENMCFYVKV